MKLYAVLNSDTFLKVKIALFDHGKYKILNFPEGHLNAPKED